MKRILKKAINKYGNLAQIDMCIEECAELIQAINKMKRINGKDSTFMYPQPIHSVEYSNKYFNLCSEIADVKIMLTQMEIIFSKEAIDLAVSRKLERLKKRLKKK
jgi:NTP pyrophosphatase (non-canonical NTP hydrolase)